MLLNFNKNEIKNIYFSQKYWKMNTPIIYILTTPEYIERNMYYISWSEKSLENVIEHFTNEIGMYPKVIYSNSNEWCEQITNDTMKNLSGFINVPQNPNFSTEWITLPNSQTISGVIDKIKEDIAWKLISKFYDKIDYTSKFYLVNEKLTISFSEKVKVILQLNGIKFDF